MKTYRYVLIGKEKDDNEITVGLQLKRVSNETVELKLTAPGGNRKVIASLDIYGELRIYRPEKGAGTVYCINIQEYLERIQLHEI